MNNNLLKNRFALPLYIVLLLTAGSCSVFRPGTTSGSGGSTEKSPSPGSPASTDTRFLNSISTGNATDKPDPVVASAGPGGGSVRSDRSRTNNNSLYRIKDKERAEGASGAPLSVLQLKYSMLTNTPVEKLDNPKLLEFMDEWYGVPYRFGGTTKKGIDCSAFTLELMENVYGVDRFPRISRDQYAASEKISRKKLREGDLVFFHTYGKGNTVTHVGVYLYNNRFVHASVSGVQIDDLDGSYYSRHFVGAGRILE